MLDVNRKQFEQTFPFDPTVPSDDIYHFDCPICNAHNTLSFGNIKTYNTYPKDLTKEEEFDVDWLSVSFCEPLKCSACDGITIMVGRGDVDRPYEVVPYDGRNVIEQCTPLYFYPPLKIIYIPLSYSSELVRDFEASFSLFWSDHKSCANKIRIAIERFLDYLDIGDPNDMINKRLLTIKSTRPEIYDPLTTIKFLGNEGSHRNDTFITNVDLLDAYEIIEPMLYEYSEEKKEKERKKQEALKRLSSKYHESKK